MLTLTFKAAKREGACKESYRKFARFKGGVNKWGEDKPFPLLEVLEHNGLDDALWALECCEPIEERDRIARLFICDCAERVLHLFEEKFPDDKRPRQAIEVARRFAIGQATIEELRDAREAAWAAWEAGAAAWEAAEAAGAAWEAGEAAEAAGAAREAAWGAAREAEREWQKEQLRRYLKD